MKNHCCFIEETWFIPHPLLRFAPAWLHNSQWSTWATTLPTPLAYSPGPISSRCWTLPCAYPPSLAADTDAQEMTLDPKYTTPKQPPCPCIQHPVTRRPLPCTHLHCQCYNIRSAPWAVEEAAPGPLLLLFVMSVGISIHQ